MTFSWWQLGSNSRGGGKEDDRGVIVNGERVRARGGRGKRERDEVRLCWNHVGSSAALLGDGRGKWGGMEWGDEWER